MGGLLRAVFTRTDQKVVVRIQEAEEWVGCSLLTGAEGLEPLQADRAGGTSRGSGHREPQG